MWLARRLVGAVFILLLIAMSAGAEPKRVLLLHSYGPYFAPWNAVAGRFREELIKRSPSVDLYEASLESARFPQPTEQGPFVDYLRALFAENAPDLIVTMGAPAAQFVQRYRPQFFTSVPLLIAAADVRTVSQAKLTINDATVATTLDLTKLIENVLYIVPDTNNIVFVIGASPLEHYWVEELRRASEPFDNRVTFRWFNKLPLEDILRESASLPPRSAIFYASVRVDALGVPQEEDRVLTRLLGVANAPIFGYTDTNFGNGIVGGPLISTAQIGQRAATVAVSILNGETPAHIKTEAIGLQKPVYDWRQLQRWNISEALLPAGSTVYFREPTIWKTYGWAVTLALAALLVQAAMIGWLLYERRVRLNAQLESHLRSQEVMHLNRAAEAGALAGAFAHELGQPLAAISMDVDAAESLIGANEPNNRKLRGVLSNIRRADQQAIDVISHFRQLLKRRREGELEGFDLRKLVDDAVQVVAAEARRRCIRLHSNEAQQPLLVRADRIHLQQVVFNLANNAMDAMSSVKIERRSMTIATRVLRDGFVEVSVGDSGIGIPADALGAVFDTFFTTKEHGTGLGLSISRTIIEAYGGRIWAENRPEGGAMFRFTLPLAEYPKRMPQQGRRDAICEPAECITVRSQS
jgi:signal transduction histidine kinase